MLKFYYNARYINSRWVWIVLLEKKIPFEAIALNLDEEEFKPHFLDISPFNPIPVVVDEGYSVVESLAILDYLEAKHPTPALLPSDPKVLATVRQVELITVNELLPAMTPLIYRMIHEDQENEQELELSKRQIKKVLEFFEKKLGANWYFGGETLTLAEVVAGTVVPLLSNLSVSIEEYPKLCSWSDRLVARESWITTQSSQEPLEAFKMQLEALISKK